MIRFLYAVIQFTYGGLQQQKFAAWETPEGFTDELEYLLRFHRHLDVQVLGFGR